MGLTTKLLPHLSVWLAYLTAIGIRAWRRRQTKLGDCVVAYLHLARAFLVAQHAASNKVSFYSLRERRA